MATPPTGSPAESTVSLRTDHPEMLKAVPLRHTGRWVSGAVLLVLGAMMVHSLALSTVQRNGKRERRFQWDVVGQFLFSGRILRGLEVTLD